MARARASTPANDGSASTLANGSASTPVSPCLAVSWAADVGSALSYLHDRRIIHRDVKPQNLLIFWDPTSAMGMGYVRTTAKLADFGLARVRPESDPTPSVDGEATPALGQRPAPHDDRRLHGVVSSARGVRI